MQLALEPEPFCFLETTDETIAYFRDHLYSGAAVEKLAKLAHVPIAEANAALRRHLGIVYDICHQAVEYEDIAASLQKLVDAGVPIFKLQEAAALHIPEVTPGRGRYAQALRQDHLSDADAGKEGRQDHPLTSTSTMPSPRSRRIRGRASGAPTSTCRCSSTISAQFRTTRFAIADALRFHKQKPLSRHLEVETYTWDMLPESLKSSDIVDYICRELDWVRGQLV